MGELLVIVSGVCFSTGTMLAQIGMRTASASAAVLIGLLMNNLFFILALLVAAKVQGLPPLNPEGVLFAAAGGVLGNILGRTLSLESVRRIGSARATSLVLTQNLFSLLFGVFLLGEVLGWISLTGIALVVSGIYWLARERVGGERNGGRRGNCGFGK